jgi:hypothetical protein
MTTDTDAIIEAEVKHVGELLPDVYEPPAPPTLFGTSDPKLALERMGKLADALMHVVRDRKLAVGIRGKEYLTVEAWTTVGALVGVHAAIAWTRPNESGDGILARAEAQTLSGALVGAGEAECSRAEQRWKSAEPHAIRAMAQTRALSRALQAPLRHIAVLAGYAGSSAEEMPADDVPLGDTDPPARARDPVPDEVIPTAEQKAEIGALLRTLDEIDPDTDWLIRCREIVGVPWKQTTATMAGRLIEKLQAEILRLADEADAA